MKKNFKGQAAMEYLMTYGWAILVLVIVIAALYYFLPKTQETCIFQQNFGCEGLPQIFVQEVSGDDGATAEKLYVTVLLSNKMGQTATNLNILCTNVGTGDITSKLFDDADAKGNLVSLADAVGPGASFKAENIHCVDANGEQLLSSEGAGFKGLLAIRYSLDTDINTDVQHTAIGTVSGTVTK